MEKKDIIQKLKENRKDSLNAMRIIENMPEDLKNELMTSKDSIMELVKAHGVVTGYLPEESISQEIILEAIKTYPKALVLAVNEKDDFNNKEFMEEAIKTNPYAILSIKSGWEQTKKLGLVSDLNAELSNKMIEEIIKQFKFKDVSNENPIKEWQKEEEYIQSVIVGTIESKAGKNSEYFPEMLEMLKNSVQRDINNPEKLKKIYELIEKKEIENVDRLAKESELQGLQEEDQEKGELLEKVEKLNRDQENEGKTVLDD